MSLYVITIMVPNRVSRGNGLFVTECEVGRPTVGTLAQVRANVLDTVLEMYADANFENPNPDPAPTLAQDADADAICKFAISWGVGESADAQHYALDLAPGPRQPLPACLSSTPP